VLELLKQIIICRKKGSRVIPRDNFTSSDKKKHKILILFYNIYLFTPVEFNGVAVGKRSVDVFIAVKKECTDKNASFITSYNNGIKLSAIEDIFNSIWLKKKNYT
jgi:hypothetical protein